MPADCYLCLALGMTPPISAVQGTLGNPLGYCHRCGVFVCGHHGLRTVNPESYKCTLCIPSHIAPSPRKGIHHGQYEVALRTRLYTNEEFDLAFPTAHMPLRRAVRDALENLEYVVQDYFGENFRERLGSTFAIEGTISLEQLSQVAVAVAVIQFARIPQQLLVSYLRRRPEAEAFL